MSVVAYACRWWYRHVGGGIGRSGVVSAGPGWHTQFRRRIGMSGGRIGSSRGRIGLSVVELGRSVVLQAGPWCHRHVCGGM